MPWALRIERLIGTILRNVLVAQVVPEGCLYNDSKGFPLILLALWDRLSRIQTLQSLMIYCISPDEYLTEPPIQTGLSWNRFVNMIMRGSISTSQATYRSYQIGLGSVPTAKLSLLQLPPEGRLLRVRTAQFGVCIIQIAPPGTSSDPLYIWRQEICT
jgi:hypothetical protein